MSRTSVSTRLRAVAATVAIAATSLVVSAGIAAPSANAATTWKSKADNVLHWASEQKGKPYHYGSAGPSAFDCSGLVLYVFKHAVSKSLSHSAAAQYNASHHINRGSLRVGDLIFVDDGGSISHVGIYAGDGYWWVAPHSGTNVQRQKIYSAHFVYGTFTH